MVFQQPVSASNCLPLRVHRHFDLTEAELTWDELTAFEERAYGLDPRLVNALSIAHMRYSEMVGLVDWNFTEFRDEERAAFPEWFDGECVYGMEKAMAFMALACQIPETQAMLWVCRVRVQQVRTGLFTDDVEAQPWAVGPVDRR